MPKAVYPSVRIFQNPWLERLTHVHPAVPAVVWTPIILFLFYRSIFVDPVSALERVLLGLVGLAAWTLAEYIFHRWIFHLDARSEWGARIEFLIHGNHHEDPKDPSRLVMPPAGSLILGVIVYSFCRFVLGPVYVDSFFAPFAVGYLIYDYTHYFIHHGVPRTRFGKLVKQHHMMHHFVSSEGRWGVSSPLWDHVFGTFEQKSARPRSTEPKPST